MEILWSQIDGRSIDVYPLWRKHRGLVLQQPEGGIHCCSPQAAAVAQQQPQHDQAQAQNLPSRENVLYHKAGFTFDDAERAFHTVLPSHRTQVTQFQA